jgi:DNA-binding transcriptional MerR regulator
MLFDNTVMKKNEQTLWTIDELSDRIAEALDDASYAGVPSGRVRDVPDLRTIRYYTTLGLLDRPAAMRGRTALYQRRHLLQLVAIKRLQARGLSLAEVQERVLGRSDTTLERIISSAATAAQTPPSAQSVTRSESFWRLDAHQLEDQANADESLAQSVALDNGLGLTLPVRRQLDDEDLRVIRMAAAPLIELLKLRGLIDIGPGPGKKGDAP